MLFLEVSRGGDPGNVLWYTSTPTCLDASDMACRACLTGIPPEHVANWFVPVLPVPQLWYARSVRIVEDPLILNLAKMRSAVVSR